MNWYLSMERLVYRLDDCWVLAPDGSFRSFLPIWTFDPHFHNCKRPWLATGGALPIINLGSMDQTFIAFRVSQNVHLSPGPGEDSPVLTPVPIVRQPTVSPLWPRWLEDLRVTNEVKLSCDARDWRGGGITDHSWRARCVPPPPAFLTASPDLSASTAWLLLKYLYLYDDLQ